MQPEPATTFDNRQEYLEAAIGPRNTDYYLARFNRFDSQGAGVSWNWPAFFVSFYWLLYRKMWWWALLYFLLPVPVLFMAGAAGLVSEAGAALVYLGYWFGIYIAFPMYANALYFRHVNRIIRKAKTYTDREEKRLRTVAAEGGTSGVAMVLIVILVFIAVMGILAAIAIPAYQEYVTRAKVNAGLEEAQAYMRRVEDFAVQNQQWPQSHADIESGDRSGHFSLGTITVIADGVVLITFGDQLDGKSIALIPSLNDQQYIVWECRGVDMDDRYLPAECRN